MLTLLTITAIMAIIIAIWATRKMKAIKARNKSLHSAKNGLLNRVRAIRKQFYKEKTRIERKVTRRDEIIKNLSNKIFILNRVIKTNGIAGGHNSKAPSKRKKL